MVPEKYFDYTKISSLIKSVRLRYELNLDIVEVILQTVLHQPCKIASAFGCADAKAEAISICVGNFIADAKPYKHLCRQHVNTVKHRSHT